MFRSLFAKLFSVFLAVLLATMALLAMLLYQRVRNDKIDAELDKLADQADEIALLVASYSVLNDPEMYEYMQWRLLDVKERYQAVVIAIDSNAKYVPIDENHDIIPEGYTREQTSALVFRILSGERIRERSQDEKGAPIFTVGVPYLMGSTVLGAVFIHTSAQVIENSYQDVVPWLLGSLLFALALGAAAIYVLSRWVTNPLRGMARAAERFARGDFSGRVETASRDEIGKLAGSFNQMAKDLGRLEQTRREFVANVSHELRSPLTSMQGFLVGMLDGTVPESEREHYMRIVLGETKRLGGLITSLLDLSRIENGQMQIVKSAYDINDRIARVMIRQETRISERNIEVELAFEDEVCRVNADADRIEQVLVNLIDNAIKFTGDGGRIVVSTQRDKDLVWIAVEDSGPGIAPEDIDHVFERFYMADKAHTRGNGTGLGLAITRSIIRQHGQEISVSSAPGHGARFEFTLEGA